MTVQEAIKIIEVAKAECEWNAPLEYQEAFDAAIEALKEQPKHDQNTSSKQPDLETFGIKTGETCEDVISRRDAIDAMTNTLWHYPNECYRNLNEYEFAKGLAELGLKSVPSALPEPHWIPCGERLPDTNRDVLLQFNNNMGIGFWENGEWGVNTGENIYSEIGEGEEKPIAWAELPEPYGGEHDG